MPRIHPALIVLKALLNGSAVRLPLSSDPAQPLTEVVIQGDDVGMIVEQTTNGGQTYDKVVYGLDLDLGAFVRACERLPADNVFMVGVDNALNLMAQEKSERRQRA